MYLLDYGLDLFQEISFFIMLLEFFTKHQKMLIIMCLLAVYGLYNMLVNVITIGVILSKCNSGNIIDILCYIFIDQSK